MYLDDSTESSRYTGYKVVLPSVSYTDLMRSFSTAHKPYSPDAGGDVGEGSAEQLVSTDMKINPVYSELSQELNTYLYDVCQKYAGNLFCNGIQLSPLLPLAEANLEGGRVDRSQTFSAMASTSLSIIIKRTETQLSRLCVFSLLQPHRTEVRLTGKYRYLTFEDRKKIEAWHLLGDRPVDIAARLSVHHTTIYKELQRGATGALDANQREGYSAELAERRLRESFKRRGKRAPAAQ